MTDKELMQQALDALNHVNVGNRVQVIEALRARLAQPEQEPVAWLEPEWGEKICPEIGFEVTITSDHPRDLCWIPLYATPPQRTWVSLTDEEIKEIVGLWGDTPIKGYTRKLFDQIEAKLKEKNR